MSPRPRTSIRSGRPSSEVDKGKTSFTEARDEAAKRGEAPGNSLYPLYVLNRAHPCDVRDLLWVGFDATLRDDETQQHTPWDPKNALLEVELNVVCLEFCKGLLKVGYDLVSLFGLNHDVINVGLNGPPDEVPEAFEHTALVCSPSVLVNTEFSSCVEDTRSKPEGSARWTYRST